MHEAKNQVNDLEHKDAKTNQPEQEKKRIQRSNASVSSLWENFKRSYIHIIGVSEKKRERARNWKSIWKSNEIKHPEFGEGNDLQVQEAQRVPNKMDANRPPPRHVIIKMPKVKDKERILKAAREKKL